MRLFVQLENGTPKAWPLIGENVRYLAPASVSFPAAASAYESVDLSAFGFETFENVTPPAHNALTQKVVELAPAKVGGVWKQQFEVQAMTDAEKAAAQAALVPQSISPRQFRQSLSHFPGFRTAVESAVAGADQDTKDWYAYATSFERSHPVVIAMAQALNYTPTQIDQVWTYGAGI